MSNNQVCNAAASKLIPKMIALCKLMRLDRPIGILLLLWPTYWGLWIAAHGMPQLYLAVIFTVGVVVMRSAGCVINDILDRNFDPHVKRTCQRPLATGALTLYEAFVTFFLLCFIALILVLMLNTLAFWLALVALGLAMLYPLLKRVTHLPQVGLGCAYSWGIPMTFAATANHVPLIAWLLVFINCLWTIAYDTEYAMVDRDDDLKINVKSTAILFGQYDRLIIMLLQCLVLLLLLILALHLQLNSYFYLLWIVGCGLFIYQQWLLKKQEPANCFRAFMHNNWFGMVIFVGLVVGS